ncbi:hypothetical protein P154DRAFT_519745 [Amniculicola lignicola CBS 123094]|uniref:Coenzyme Q-binding protein COQ10 START domain-containing protein n=1 Tax=Amniculicola lignicola CBS 123094 TaxID=1392246 RepID=A0A6A5X190_9PLEO|nr:hypothetical protein P154DRAFT_519745 [Amniculicola lignicola CBS 123094]
MRLPSPRLCFFNLIFSLLILLSSSQTTNLPDVPPGVFTVGTRLEIRTNVSTIWDVLTDFPAYASWNPFVRSAIVTTPFGVPTREQYPIENHKLILRNQIPPLPFPVDSSTPDNPLNTQFAFENITHIQPDKGRLAWEYIFEAVLQAERWQAISDLGNGKVLYESREVFHGLAAETLKVWMGEGLQKGFEAQAEGLRRVLEG